VSGRSLTGYGAPKAALIIHICASRGSGRQTILVVQIGGSVRGAAVITDPAA
jgi:hypothetical protein